MVWQDIVIALANVLFGYSLIHQTCLGFKKKKAFLAIRTSYLTTMGLYAMSLAFFTLTLHISSLIAFFNGTLWLILFIQGLIYKDDTLELTEQTKKEIEIARKEFKEGKFVSHAQLKEELGI